MIKGHLAVGVWDVLLLVFIFLVAIGITLYFVNRWASRRMADQQEAVERNKTTVSIYIIDKKKDRVKNANLPKIVHEQMPRWSRLMKMPLVKAKIGPQIMTLMCDGKVYEALPLKKTVKVDLAGIYIVSMKGMKTKREMADLRRARKRENADITTDTPRKSGSPWYDVLLARLRRHG